MTRFALTSAILLLAATAALAQPEPKKAMPASPWGVSSSASAFKDHAEWLPKMADAGVRTVRWFPEWNGVERTKGKWTWDDADAIVAAAGKSGVEINGIMMGSPPGAKFTHAFPMDDLDGWSAYVSGSVGRYAGKVKHWEVWNEGNGGFNDGKHTAADYAKLAAVTYAAAKKADPDAKVGLSVASFDPAYLDRAVRVMKAAGTPDRFDHLCIHPYELADGLDAPDGEIAFLGMTRTLRAMLKDAAPDKADADIWITEVGRRVEKRKGRTVTDADAAAALVKTYTLALAQGVARTQWFEARDPVGEDQGFGLLDRKGEPRASYTAMKTMTKLLSTSPKYVGWLALGEGGRGYGFVFDDAGGPALVAWATAGQSGSLKFTADVDVTDLQTATTTKLKADTWLGLTGSPVFVTKLPDDTVNQAKANAAKPFPWGGDFTKAKTVSLTLGEKPRLVPLRGGRPLAFAPEGVFVAGRSERPTVKFPDGSTGTLLEGDIEHPIGFFVHPTFASFATRDYYVRATVRRVAKGNAGMNLIYEAYDRKGTSYVNAEKWFGTADADGWQTHTWHVTDACFAKMWGNDFSLRPEQSIPFALGKVEVSTEPFK